MRRKSQSDLQSEVEDSLDMAGATERNPWLPTSPRNKLQKYFTEENSNTTPGMFFLRIDELFLVSNKLRNYSFGMFTFAIVFYVLSGLKEVIN